MLNVYWGVVFYCFKSLVSLLESKIENNNASDLENTRAKNIINNDYLRQNIAT